MDHRATHPPGLSLLTRLNNEKEASISDIKVLTWVGSLRAASVNPQIAALAAATAPAGTTVNVYQGLGAGLGELPLYNEDIDNMPLTYPHRLARCAAPLLKPTRSWW